MLKEVFVNLDWILFFHFVGIIIGLGAVTVIDVMGFFSRRSKKKTQDTIAAHHTTKPLIWIGTIIILITWAIMTYGMKLEGPYLIKGILLAVMIVNGSVLSFHISPRLDKLIGKKVLLPKSLQIKIGASLIISFISWWLFVILTVWMI
ncbi:MAG: hypothetical protein KC516_03505 [Nanoarchaeota archaeon]|nr:hypothetical protein [Nanoarchaeota archaeon]